MRVLVLGATGMLGNAVFRVFNKDGYHEVWGTLRDKGGLSHFSPCDHERLITGVNVLDIQSLINVIDRIKPHVVVNCVGLIKQLEGSKNPLTVLPINSILPHQLASLCSLAKARLVHISTDCVFDGSKGNYLESDLSNAGDLYGKSKFIGELHDVDNSITLRTSIIGHELSSNSSLVDWFLSQDVSVKGFARAIFSGLPTVELARVIKDYVLPNTELNGLYHVSAAPISKLDLLRLIALEYNKDITIIPDSEFVINRSLNSERFTAATGYVAPAWSELVRIMHAARHTASV